MFGLLFLLGFLNLNSFRISLEKEKECLCLGSTKSRPLTIFFFSMTSLGSVV